MGRTWPPGGGGAAWSAVCADSSHIVAAGVIRSQRGQREQRAAGLRIGGCLAGAG
jgi:hypothetical protein